MFHTIFYLPLYNSLIFLTGLFGGSLGFAVVGLTLIVKIVLSPLSYQATVTQIEQKKLTPFINEIRKKYPNQKEQGEKLNELYKEHKTHPLSGCLLILLQLPVLFAIVYVFKAGSVVNPADLYHFIHVPASINANFLWMDMTRPNVILLIITAFFQYLQVELSPSLKAPAGPVDKSDTQAAMAANMQKMTKYMIPVLIIAGGWKFPAALALYWTVSSIFMIVQEQFVMVMVSRKSKNVHIIKAK